ncbi:MAG: mechanosensitive ion channel [Candidatus Paracaedibacteraceae bacterium]|nr:mechanosensitive ion channel [Candidatus Paracaedibacteraceae bacterium]
MKRIIYLALFLSTITAIVAAILYLIPNPNHLSWFKKGTEILLLIFSTWVLLRLLNRFIWPGIRENFKLKISHLFVVILNILIVLTLLFVITVGTLSLDINTIITASGLITAGLAIALQGLIGDVAASIIIDLDRLYRIGDWIKLDDSTEGKITDIGWRHTELLTLTNTKIIINNGRVLTTTIQNFGQGKTWAVDEFQISINHDIPSDRVRRIVETALQRHSTARQFYAEVLARTLDAGGVNYFVRYGLANQEQRWQARHSIIDALRQELHAYDLRISEGLGEYGIVRGNQPLVEKEFSNSHQHLQKSNLFQGFSDQQLQQIIALSSPILVQAATPIIHKGERDQTLYIIGEGTVEIFLADQQSRFLYSGDYFGEQSFLLGHHRTADVTAKTNVLLYKYSKTELEPILKFHPEALHKMLHIMVNRSADLKEAITEAQQTSSNETLEEIIIKTVKEFLSA